MGLVEEIAEKTLDLIASRISGTQDLDQVHAFVKVYEDFKIFAVFLCQDELQQGEF